LSQHITAPPPPPSRIAPSNRPVSPAFERLILKAMSKERDKRFPSMQALGEALGEADRRAAAETLEPLDPDAPSLAVELAELPANRRAAVVDEVVPDLPRSAERPARSLASGFQFALWALAGAA